MRERPLRPVFLNEGLHGAAVLGHAPAAAALRLGLEGRADVTPTFVGLPPMGRWRELVSRPLGPLYRAGIDLQPSRWHAVQALSARRVLDGTVSTGELDALHVTSHIVSLALGRWFDTPTFLAVDAAMDQWESFGVWGSRAVPATLAGSRIAERRALERAHAVLAYSEWTAEGVNQAAPRARVCLHHPGLDLQTFVPVDRADRPRPRILFVGGRFAEKGGEDLLRAIGDLAGAQLDIDLVTPAPVPPRDGIRVHRLRTGDPELVSLFQQADLLCLPTYADAVPFVVLEAMAVGTPVVATSVGGIQSAAGDAAVTVRPGDVTALRRVVLDLLADADRRAAMGRAGRRRCEERHDCRRQADALVRLMRAA